MYNECSHFLGCFEHAKQFLWQLNCVAKEFLEEFLSLTGL